MSGFLRKLLDAREPLFTLSLKHLETATGNKGVDVGYIADITHRAHAVMRQMGLDIADTKPIELYRALHAHVEEDELFVQTDDVALIIGETDVLSFNREDIRENSDVPYEQRTFRHMQAAVKRGLMDRYTAAKRKTINSMYRRYIYRRIYSFARR